MVRTLILGTSIFFSSFLSFFLVFTYSNLEHTVEYYSIGEVNPLRFELSRQVSIFSLLNQREQSGIDPLTLDTLSRDPHIEKWYAFSIVDVPSIIRVGAFGYFLETDIPVFTVSDSLLCPSLTCSPVPLGFSRALLDFYNLNLAGTAEFFPKIPDALLRSTDTFITIGTSKAFEYSGFLPSVFTGRITDISSDFPGMGLTIPESVARMALDKMGKTLGRPIRVVGYVKSQGDIASIRSTYPNYTIRFDTDKEASLREKLSFIRFLFQVFTAINLAILTFIIGLFIFDILRQYSPLFRTFRMVGVPLITNFAIVVGEILLTALLFLTLSIIGFVTFSIFGRSWLMGKLIEMSLTVPILSISPLTLIGVVLLYILFLGVLTTIFSAREILKKWEG